jgi:hypothetical protein
MELPQDLSTVAFPALFVECPKLHSFQILPILAHKNLPVPILRIHLKKEKSRLIAKAQVYKDWQEIMEFEISFERYPLIIRDM